MSGSFNEVQKAASFDIGSKARISVLSTCVAGIPVISAEVLFGWLRDQCMNVITF